MVGSGWAGRQRNPFYDKTTNQPFPLLPSVGPYPNPCCCLHGACKYRVTANASWSLPKYHQRGKCPFHRELTELAKVALNYFFIVVISKFIDITIVLTHQTTKHNYASWTHEYQRGLVINSVRS